MFPVMTSRPTPQPRLTAIKNQWFMAVSPGMWWTTGDYFLKVTGV